MLLICFFIDKNVNLIVHHII